MYNVLQCSLASGVHREEGKKQRRKIKETMIQITKCKLKVTYNYSGKSIPKLIKGLYLYFY